MTLVEVRARKNVLDRLSVSRIGVPSAPNSAHSSRPGSSSGASGKRALNVFRTHLADIADLASAEQRQVIGGQLGLSRFGNHVDFLRWVAGNILLART
jgi:hypothetical protein